MKAFQRWRDKRSTQSPKDVKVLAPNTKEMNHVFRIEANGPSEQRITKSVSSSALLATHTQKNGALAQQQRRSSAPKEDGAVHTDNSSSVEQFYSPSRIRFDSIVNGGGDRPRTKSSTQRRPEREQTSELQKLPKKRSFSVAEKKFDRNPVIVVGQDTGRDLKKGTEVQAPSPPAHGMPVSSQNGHDRGTNAILQPLSSAERRPSSTSQQSSSLNVGLRPSMLHIDAVSTSPSSASSAFENSTSAGPSRQSVLAADMWDADALRKTPTLSLKKSKDRLSGMLGTWRRSPSGQSFDQQSPSVHEVGSPVTTQSKSQMLANELNELAIAFDEGLLGEEEYRMLRKGVFDKMMTQGEMEIPKESTLRASQTSPADLSSGMGNGDDGRSYVTSSHSKRSGRSSNLRSIFRSNSQSGHSVANRAPLSSDRSGFSSVAGSRFGSSNAVKEHVTLQEQYSQARRARTLRGVSSMNALEGEAVRTKASGADDRSHINGAMSSAGSARTNFSVGGISISTGNGMLGGSYGEKSSAQISAEMAVVESEKKRMLDNFKTLEVQAIGRYNLSFEQIRKACAEAEQEIRQSTATQQGPARSPGGKLLNGSPYPPSSSKKAERIRRTSSKDGSTFVQTYEDTADEAALRSELIVVLKKRADVSANYDDRIAFLRSAMRSAKIREGLR